MNREIRFRVWDYNEKRFIEETNADPHICWNGTVYCHERKEDGDVLVSGIRNITVQQYTGMKDKNGTEIYEGDIIKYPIPVGWSTNSLPMKTIRVDEVKFVTGCFIPDIWRTVVDDCEVIGNIFEKDIKLDTSS